MFGGTSTRVLEEVLDELSDVKNGLFIVDTHVD
jgi:hypothetical protein